jgi:hypothetical protein
VNQLVGKLFKIRLLRKTHQLDQSLKIKVWRVKYYQAKAISLKFKTTQDKR